MKKFLLVAMIAVFAAFVFAGCNAEELKKLNDQVASLTAENQTLKAKVADLDKGKADLQGQLTAANASLAGLQKEIADAKAAAEAAAAAKPGKKGAKAAKKDAAAPAKAPKAKAAKKAK
ncbi:MAG: hypothetical protein WC889_17845 [Myxococcota bacterium]|jgi:predicted  nucleic acid-binding Zn-ribbon protein